MIFHRPFSPAETGRHIVAKTSNALDQLVAVIVKALGVIRATLASDWCGGPGTRTHFSSVFCPLAAYSCCESHVEGYTHLGLS